MNPLVWAGMLPYYPPQEKTQGGRVVNVAVMHTDRSKGRRDFMFPPLPEALTDSQQIALCRQWVKDELVSRGMICEYTIYDTREVMVSCTTRKIEPYGLGDVVEEWGTYAFFARIKASFTKVVNDELHNMGLHRSFTFL